ncbi:cytochrome P450 [Amycolatopsis thermoflava]|uniref:cytochrome P450 n=1 Tax=Amycolatopsis thermoflava TaxID=84480 RepID=UPI0003FB4D32|nr:cytochrome P450 [Amycolatopsis thermoflava]
MDSTTGVPSAPETDFDHHDTSLSRDEVLDVYTSLREQCPVTHSSAHGGYFNVTRYEGVRAVTTSPDRFSSADGVLIPSTPLPPIPPLEFDGTEHEAWQKIMQAPLVPAEVRKHQPLLDDVVRTEIDGFAREGKADLWSDFADAIPALVIGRLIGLSPSSAPRMRALAMGVLNSLGSGNEEQASEEFFDFTSAELASRREDPRDDYLTQLATGSFGGRTLSDAEVGGILVAFFIGGHHSTAASIVGLLHHILTVEGLREAVTTDPSTLPKAIEESLRLTTPLPHFARKVLQDTEIEGVPIPAGGKVLLNYLAANRDPRRFDDPEKFDLDRRRNQHLAFGYGTHMCIGRHLARAELATAATQLLHRLPDIEIDGDVRFTGLIGGNIMQIASLPVRFTPEHSDS